MQFRLPDWLNYEIRHKAERFREWYERLQFRDALNDNPRVVLSVTLFSAALLVVVLLLIGREAPARHYPTSKNAWFYDLNTGKLFVGSGRQTGPIEAPSGPLPNGEPAGLRAHVYSFVPAPKDSELFVGFLEKPDPQTNIGQLTFDLGAFEEWTRGRLIKCVGDEDWVSPTSVRGHEIIQGLTQPNREGQTPMYHLPE